MHKNKPFFTESKADFLGKYTALIDISNVISWRMRGPFFVPRLLKKRELALFYCEAKKTRQRIQLR